MVEVVQPLGSETYLHLAGQAHSFVARVRPRIFNVEPEGLARLRRPPCPLLRSGVRDGDCLGPPLCPSIGGLLALGMMPELRGRACCPMRSASVRGPSETTGLGASALARLGTARSTAAFCPASLHAHAGTGWLRAARLRGRFGSSRPGRSGSGSASSAVACKRLRRLGQGGVGAGAQQPGGKRLARLARRAPLGQPPFDLIEFRVQSRPERCRARRSLAPACRRRRLRKMIW